MGSFLGVPITAGGEAFGTLYLCDKQAAATFSEEDEDVVVALGLAAGLAIDKARLHGRMRHLSVTEERERIARDLHSTVIQRLFTVGLSLQGTLRLETSPAAAARVQEAIDEVDDTIHEIRSTVFAMNRQRRLSGGVRAEILELLDNVAGLDIETRVDLDGPMDELDPYLVDHLLLLLREAVSNVVHHDRPRLVEVDVCVDEGALQVRVSTDGVAAGGGGGLATAAVEERAKLLGGSCELCPRPEGGTELLWRVPRSTSRIGRP
jgi:signal transduction histidine kinase